MGCENIPLRLGVSILRLWLSLPSPRLSLSRRGKGKHGYLGVFGCAANAARSAQRADPTNDGSHHQKKRFGSFRFFPLFLGFLCNPLASGGRKAKFGCFMEIARILPGTITKHERG